MMQTRNELNLAYGICFLFVNEVTIYIERTYVIEWILNTVTALIVV